MSNYIRLTIGERKAIENGLNKKDSISKIAWDLKRSKSTIKDEIDRNRTIAKGKHKGEKPINLPSSICKKLCKSPYVCNGCTKRNLDCYRPIKIEYLAKNAHSLAEARFSDARSGLDVNKEQFEQIERKITDLLKKKLSPYQISLQLETPKISQSTIYRWVNAGYGDLSRLDLPKSVRYRPRHHERQPKTTSHGKSRSYEAFCKLSCDEISSACEMDTVIGRKLDSQCILTLYHRTSKFQFAILLRAKTVEEVNNALNALERITGRSLFSELFGLILTDNGTEFYDYEMLEASCLNKKIKRLRLYYCDVRASGQKGGCEKNHVELRKIIPKQGISFDSLSNWDMATLMSHVNSQPRSSLGGKSPIAILKAIYSDRINGLLENLGIREVPANELNMSPKILEIERL